MAGKTVLVTAVKSGGFAKSVVSLQRWFAAASFLNQVCFSEHVHSIFCNTVWSLPCVWRPEDSLWCCPSHACLVYGDEGLLLNLGFTIEAELTGQQASGRLFSLFDDLASHTQEGPQLGKEIQLQLSPGKGNPSFSHNHVASVLVLILKHVAHRGFEFTESLLPQSP